ncbi:hypothetical protein BO82DRAFT_68885 [Aspergillus uvarum CBS 121591]|uniref:Uncharacterized protein n=1 Tax=Aspergillus uvarum CBS 121591 TaxID=1448315 RepID=A0A319CCP5_9EURO|nr:hypothetical protein BO82DRAFT_68885 [Aspergillus uvarum CBS 121591]PYH82160.1 hypothetical protein BO82DRAFT_68885 [Aspergillus uvarum CBS 121591]
MLSCCRSVCGRLSFNKVNFMSASKAEYTCQWARPQNRLSLSIPAKRMSTLIPVLALHLLHAVAEQETSAQSLSTRILHEYSHVAH